jgi:uncharacterized protein YacL
LYRSDWGAAGLRSCFLILLAAVAAVFRPFSLPPYLGAICGGGIGLLAWLSEILVRKAEPRSVLGGFVGLLVGVLAGFLLVSPWRETTLTQTQTGAFFLVVLPFIAAYVGLMAGIARSDLIPRHFLAAAEEGNSALKILDTSVLIDGRISDVAQSGFIDGRLLIPQFILHELQSIADSADSAKRNRGRRGLDVVQRLQSLPNVSVQLSSKDFPDIREVDRKLIELARFARAKIMTNDFNLNKLAQVQGVDVLNINELANSLKPIVLPGESMRVFILKEGKEHNQGVAYLDDGTMVVVDNARRLISKHIDITVTSVLQTTAGKMIFGKYDERQQSVTDVRQTGSGVSATASAGMPT